jgi:hypothetical protein
MESVDEMSAWQEFSESYPDNIAVRGFLHTPATPSGDGLVLTHGAGANCQAPLLVALANEFSERGLTVLRFDLPFRQLRPHGPPIRGSAERDQQGVQHAIESMRKLVPGRVFAAGHSYGGRQSSICAASNPKLADGLLLLSYPCIPRSAQPNFVPLTSPICKLPLSSSPAPETASAPSTRWQRRSS